MNSSQVLLCGSVRLRRQLMNSDGQQFHWHQQNKQLHVTLAHWTLKKTTTSDVGNSGPGLGQAQICGGVKYTEYYPLILSIRYSWHSDEGKSLRLNNLIYMINYLNKHSTNKIKKQKIPHCRNSSKIPHCRNSSKIPHCLNSSKIPHCRNSSKIPRCLNSSKI